MSTVVRHAVTIGTFVIAASRKIGGFFSVWMMVRTSRSPLGLLPGAAALALFAALLTLGDGNAAERAFAGYGGIYILASLL